MSIERALQVISFLIATAVLIISTVIFFSGFDAASVPHAALPLLGEGSTSTLPSDQKSLAANFASSSPAPLNGELPKNSTTSLRPIAEVKKAKRVQTPGPLIPPPPSSKAPTMTSAASSTGIAVPQVASPDALTAKDVIVLTNAERAKEHLSPLSTDDRLSRMAEAKAKDMIDRQYFAHMSPTGVDVVGLSLKFGYDYLNIGENLALGDFVSSRDVVTGWMNSPGHRANIMNTSYHAIGVAAMKGSYQGKVVWYAVQEFGRPITDCPPPAGTVQKQIDDWEADIALLEKTMATLDQIINNGDGDAATQNSVIDEFNATVAKHNDLVAAVKSAIKEYNTEVDRYNACISS
jgi:uncharacterized protein YkwD